ncbi:hypothetical protein AMATHDRAFT_77307 [Amanita thiersii Skay4041]|uniref:Methyltransferase n=1 Tax=Amanita thiersii Skay4041 TaxID=703135 RepID=A0A2A9NHS0_9AGAR|nr:hypothetical protein AMATHDRAFT_77307 [Amanita thiersii Skay4041]
MSDSFVKASISYGVRPADGSPAYQHINANPVTGKREKNWTLKEREVEIENIRGKEDSFTLDTAGFQFYTRPAKHKSFTNDEEIEKEYYPESAELIKELTGASRVVFFDHTIRRQRPGQLKDDPQNRKPVLQAHVDQTKGSSIARVHRHLPAAEAPELLKRRFQIINLWRPIEHPALEWPLALCDFRSVNPDEDVFASALVYPDRQGETFAVSHNPNHKWKYLRGMTPDDFVLIKCFDSVQDGNMAVFAPHTAFQDPTTPEGVPHRQSIELRALVFYD